MSKKGGTIVKIVAVLAGVAAVGTACYLYKDKIKEFFQKINLKDKIDTAKSFVTDKVLGTGEEDFFDDADFFDDDLTEEAADSADNSNRGYTSINISADSDNSSEAQEEAPAAEAEETADTTEAVAEATEEEEAEEDIPYENEGLSDVSEDEDVLAEQTSLDGAL